VLFDAEEIRRFDLAMQDQDFRRLFAARNGVQFDPGNMAHVGDGGGGGGGGGGGARGARGGGGGARAGGGAAYVRGQGTFCPYCRTHNRRQDRNNHATCTTCRKKFCMNCSAPVRNPAQHFRPGGPCKQHSV
jgi:hypothetical protein